MIRIIGLCLVLVSTFGFAESKVVITTNIGEIELKLFDEQAPESVANFLSYSEDGFYDETLFHRVIPNFMIQGGGFEKGLIKKSTKAPIKNEAKSIVPNRRGTIAMARTNDPHSATSQFFINVIDNNFLNKSVGQAGYAVFGEVTSGMEIVDRISTVKTGQRGPYRDVPIDDVIILSVKKVN